jgi:hypothetical protein
MCPKCKEIRQAIDDGPKESIKYYLELGPKFEAALSRGDLDLVAGDCPVADVGRELEAEEHFTIQHYFQCVGCNEIFFWGICIRGAPIYRYGESIPSNRALNNMIWGRLGSAFEKKLWWKLW